MADMTPYTWFTDTKNRVWLLIAVPIEPYFNDQNHLTFRPAGDVILLEFGKSETIRRPFEEIQKYIIEKTFKPLKTP